MADNLRVIAGTRTVVGRALLSSLHPTKDGASSKETLHDLAEPNYHGSLLMLYIGAIRVGRSEIAERVCMYILLLIGSQHFGTRRMR